MSFNFRSISVSSRALRLQPDSGPPRLVVAVLAVAAMLGLASPSLAYVKDSKARGELAAEIPCAAEKCAELGIDRWLVYRAELTDGPAAWSSNDPSAALSPTGELFHFVGIDADRREVSEFRIAQAGLRILRTEFPDDLSPTPMTTPDGDEILYDSRGSLVNSFMADAIAVDAADIVSHTKSSTECIFKKLAYYTAVATATAACATDPTKLTCWAALSAVTVAYDTMRRACGDIPDQVCTPGESQLCHCAYAQNCGDSTSVGYKYCRPDGLGWTGCNYGCPSAPPEGCDDMCPFPGQVDFSGYCTEEVCPEGQLGQRVCESDLTWGTCACEGDSNYHVCDYDGQVNPLSEGLCADVSCPDSEESAVQVCIEAQDGRRDWSDCLCQSSVSSACTEVGLIDSSSYCQDYCSSGSGRRYCTTSAQGELQWGLCFCDGDGGDGGEDTEDPEDQIEILPEDECPPDFECGVLDGGAGGGPQPLWCRTCEILDLGSGDCLVWHDHWFICGTWSD